MKVYVKTDEAGIVEQVNVSADPVEGFTEVVLEPGYTIADVGYMMKLNGVLVPRPFSPVPYVENNQIIVPPCPIGTKISVSDVVGHEVMGIFITESDELPEEISFPDPGRYRVEVQAPFPHIYSAIELEIL
jgi:hypothetical protein